MESYAYIKENYKVPEEYQPEWIGMYYDYDPLLLLKLLKGWKEKTPPRKVLESLKSSIDFYYYNGDIYDLFDYITAFCPVPQRLIGLLMVNFMSNTIEKKTNLELIELLIYFNAHLEGNCLKIINGFKYWIKIYRMLAHNFTSEEYISAEEYFYPDNEKYEDLVDCWLLGWLNDPEKLIKILEDIYFEEDIPCSVMGDLKNILNKNYYHYNIVEL